ncbi:MAG: hypothetical protein ABI550_04520, partial [Ignavibacteriaceae bacterium]
NLDSNRKKQLKHFRKIESSFIYDRKILTEFLLNTYYNFLNKVNASTVNYFNKETLKYICSLENIFMVGAGGANNPEAVYIFSYTPYIADCLINVAVPEGREYSTLLFWGGLKYFRSKKIPLINLGGGVKLHDKIALSKERFGGYKLPFKSLKQIYDLNAYNKLCIEKGVDPDDLSGYFPPYRKV